jgi:O-methyltransferase
MKQRRPTKLPLLFAALFTLFGFSLSRLSTFSYPEDHSAVSIQSLGLQQDDSSRVLESLKSTNDASDAYIRDHYSRHYSMEELAPIFAPWTMVFFKHQILAVRAITKLNLNKVPGDIVECGVWKGGMTMGMIFANMRDNIDRHFWLYDTFEGLPQPSERDEERAHQVWDQVQKGDPTVNDVAKHRVEDGKWNYGALDLVKSNVYYTHYPRDKIHFIKGKVEDTLPITKLPEKIALLRLDTDWYDSTLAELNYLWDRLVPEGVLIIDDFCTWGGSRKAPLNSLETSWDWTLSRFPRRNFAWITGKRRRTRSGPSRLKILSI